MVSWPTAKKTFPRAVNNLKHDLTANVYTGDGVINVTTTAGSPTAPFWFHIDNECIYCTEKTANTYGTVANPCLRGQDGTTDGDHLVTALGGEVKFGMEAHYLNEPYDEIEAIQTDIGITGTADTDSLRYKVTTLESGTVSWVIDEDDMASNLDTKVPTQQSVKAYVDNNTTSITIEYDRDIVFKTKTVAEAADRYKVLTPNRMPVYFNDTQFYLSAQVELDLSASASWDTTAGTDFRVAANRAGKDFYIYACDDGSTTPKILVSGNTSAPSGYNTTTSKKVAGFHCLCVAVGTIASHSLTDYLAGDILPQSVWDLKHMPASPPEGMVYDPNARVWVDIYLASVSGSTLVSVYGGSSAHGGAGAPGGRFHWYKFSQWFAYSQKKMCSQDEFVSFSLGSNQGTTINGGADPTTTGGFSDTAGRRMISHIGVEDCCGNRLQWGRDRGGGAGAASFKDAYDANDSNVGGQSYLEPNCALFGGLWSVGVRCGSRCSVWISSPLALASDSGSRGVSEPRVG